MGGQDELVRVVRTAGGELALGRRHPGRGAWLCRASPECVAMAERRGAFARALRAPVDPRAVASLRARLAEGMEADAPGALARSGGKRARIGDRRSSSRKD